MNLTNISHVSNLSSDGATCVMLYVYYSIVNGIHRYTHTCLNNNNLNCQNTTTIHVCAHRFYVNIFRRFSVFCVHLYSLF